MSLKRFGLILLSSSLLASCVKRLTSPIDVQGHTLLRSQIETAIKDFEGDVGVYARHLKTKEEISIRAHELFPAASLIKVPILLKLFDRIAKNELKYNQELVYTSTDSYKGEGLLEHFMLGSTIPLNQLVWMTASISDNGAALWCQDLAGGGEIINAWLASKGFKETRVNSRTAGREDFKKLHGWGQTTPKEMSQMLAGLYEGGIIDQADSEELLRVLSKSYWDTEALSSLPPEIHSASKQGAVDRSRSEAVLVFAPSGPYVFTVITKNQKDTSWTRENAGFELLRKISKILWEHFEPQTPWKPAAGFERYFKE